MDSSSDQTSLCENHIYGCRFASSSVERMVKHFQWCTFHPVRCFLCKKTVEKLTFDRHYIECCESDPAPPYPAEEVSNTQDGETIRTMAQELHSLQEQVGKCTLGMEKLLCAMGDVAAHAVDVKGMTEKEGDLEAIMKDQAYVTQELSQRITIVAEKVSRTEAGVNDLNNRLDKNADAIVKRVDKLEGVVKNMEKELGTISQRAENVACSVKECGSDVGTLSSAIRGVAADAAEVKFVKDEQQDLKASVKQLEGSIKELGEEIVVNAEKLNEVKHDIGTILQQAQKMDDLMKEVQVLTRPRADQNRIHWYVEDVSKHIEQAKDVEESSVKSDVFVVRGYSMKLWFQVTKREADFCLGLFLVLCRGPNDSLLQWPFRIPYALALIHPDDTFKTKECRLAPPCNCPEYFLKPKREENVGVGKVCLCTVEEARNEGYIENDAVCFTLTLYE